MMNRKVKNLVVKSLCSILIISALILSFNVFSNSIILAGYDKDKGCSEIVKSTFFDMAGQDKVGGGIV